MSKVISPYILIGGAAAAYFLFLRPQTSAAQQVVQPGSTVLPVSAGGAVYGINSGVKGGNGSFYTCSNYNQVLAAYPNIGNPNYQLSQVERAQYLSNYIDLQQGLPTWVGKKQPDGTTPQDVYQAAQAHWKYFGCAEKRIFVPLTPPSTSNYIPPPQNATSSSGGGGFLSGALSVVSTVAPYAIAALAGVDQASNLNDADLELLFSAKGIFNEVLPFYNGVARVEVNKIHDKIDNTLKLYV